MAVAILILDLGDTLVRGEKALPNVPQALETLATFAASDGTPLTTCLVSDYEKTGSLDVLFDEFLALLDGFGLRHFFEPVERRVTLSLHAGVPKPDRRVFDAALMRLGSTAPLTSCLFVTEQSEHVKAARLLGMQALQFGPDGDFENWSEGPLLIAQLIGAPDAANRDSAIALRLRALDIADVQVQPSPNADVISARGMRNVRVTGTELGDLDGVFVPMPVQVTGRQDGTGRVHDIKVTEPSADEVAEVSHFVKVLHENKRVAVSGQTVPGATHVVEQDPDGRKVLRRQRFHAK